ncbi:MAG: hypothetical protein IJA17_05040 [Oscillospiraceae bacterium]|nr:hypothetical protein [Oscillospiraceae bacterium]
MYAKQADIVRLLFFGEKKFFDSPGMTLVCRCKPDLCVNRRYLCIRRRGGYYPTVFENRRARAGNGPDRSGKNAADFGRIGLTPFRLLRRQLLSGNAEVQLTALLL